jgi:hypothetical protein
METEKRFIVVMAVGILVIVFLLVAALVFVPIPASGEEAAKYVLAYLLGVGNSIVGYFWGSSKGSADKTEIMGRKPHG